MLNILLLVAGFVLLIWGASKLIDGASSLAKRHNIPDIVIGLTIVAFGTSAPELVINVFAATAGSSEIVMGNVLGSNIFNVLGILGISAIFRPLSVKNNTTWFEIPLSLLAALVVLVSAADIFLDRFSINIISRSDGIILLFLFIIFIVYNFQLAKTNKETETIDLLDHSKGRLILYTIIGLAGLVVGGRMIVYSAVNIATLLGISQRIISLTIVSIGTSLPELATSVMAVRKQKVDIAIGNAVGSNIFNIFLVLGISTIILPVPVMPGSFFDMGLNISASLLLFIFIFTGRGRRIERLEGTIFVILYIAYLIFLIRFP